MGDRGPHRGQHLVGGSHLRAQRQQARVATCRQQHAVMGTGEEGLGRCTHTRSWVRDRPRESHSMALSAERGGVRIATRTKPLTAHTLSSEEVAMSPIIVLGAGRGLLQRLACPAWGSGSPGSDRSRSDGLPRPVLPTTLMTNNPKAQWVNRAQETRSGLHRMVFVGK